jgi:hypothetical protein
VRSGGSAEIAFEVADAYLFEGPDMLVRAPLPGVLAHPFLGLSHPFEPLQVDE